MLYRFAVYDSRLEHLRDTSVNGVTLGADPSVHVEVATGSSGLQIDAAQNGSTYKVFNCAARVSENNGRGVVGLLSLGLRIHTNKVQLIPHGLHQLVDIPSVFRTDGHGIGDSVQQIKLLNADRVHLVQTVNHRDVAKGGVGSAHGHFPLVFCSSDRNIKGGRCVYLRLLASRTSIRSSTVASQRMVMSAELIRYSLITALISPWSM